MMTIEDALAAAVERVKELNAKLEDHLAGYEPEPSVDVSPALSNEARAERLWDDDRRLFVRNLGWLLSQTRCGVVSCELYGDQDREYVIARYDHGGKREIDVTADSYLAIIKDVTKRVQGGMTSDQIHYQGANQYGLRSIWAGRMETGAAHLFRHKKRSTGCG